MATPEIARPLDLVHNADIAMYAAKNQGKDQYVTFAAGMRSGIPEVVRPAV